MSKLQTKKGNSEHFLELPPVAVILTALVAPFAAFGPGGSPRGCLEVNFYRMFPGDYVADTSQLTLAEHGAYMLMLHFFYHTEQPLPSGAKLYRLLRCETKADRDAVDYVVDRYWVTQGGGLVNRKAVDELNRAIKLSNRNRENGGKGGRPKTQNKTQTGTQIKPKKNPVGFDWVSSGLRSGKATPEPEPDNYTVPREDDHAAS